MGEDIKKKICTDLHLVKNQNFNASKKEIKLEFQNSSFDHVKSLVTQGALVTAVHEVLPQFQISKWAKVTETLSTTLFCFAWKALQQ